MSHAVKMRKKEWFDFNKAMVLLFIVLTIGLLRAIITPETDLAEEAEIVLERLTNGDEEIRLLSSNTLLEEKVENLNQMDYDEVKAIFGVKSDFCIYFEDVTGNLIKIDGVGFGIGSDKIHINGQPCK